MVDKIKSQKTLGGNYGVRYLPETAVPGYLRYAGDHKDIRVSHFFRKVLLIYPLDQLKQKTKTKN